MKKLILSLMFLAAAAGRPAWAGDPGHQEITGYGGYGVSYVGVTASSTTAGSVPAMGSTKWREVHCVANDLTVTSVVFSRVSETAVSTTTLATAGGRLPFTANLGRHWNTSRGVYFSVGAGVTAVSLDCEVWTQN